MALAVVLATFLTLRPALRNGFVNWDDPRMFLEGPAPTEAGRFTLHGLRQAWLTTRLGEYMPVTWMSVQLDRAIWGLDPLGYHLTSLLLHTLTALGVYGLALLLAPAAHPLAPAGAALAALGFALHPLRVEPVAWASARGTVLGTLLLLVAVLAYVAGARRSRGGPLPVAWLGLSVTLYVASLLARATGAVLPAVLVLLDIWPLGRLGGGPGRLTGAAVRPIWREKLWYLLPALAVSLLAILARAWSGDPFRMEGYAPLSAVVTALRAPAFYLGRTILPVGLSPVYERDLTGGAIPPTLLGAAGVTIGITALLVVLRRRFAGVLTAWLSSLLLLLPVSGLVPGSLVHLAADRYTYGATIPWAVALGVGLARGLGGRRARWRWWQEVVGGVMAVTILVVWSGLSRRQIAVWRDPASLWTHAVIVTPESAVARFNLAVVWERQGRLADAVAGYRFAAHAWPGYAPFHVALGRTLARCGQLGPAIIELGTAVHLRPNDGEARAALGAVLLVSGEPGAAVVELERALALDPNLAEARRDLPLARERLGRGTKTPGADAGGGSPPKPRSAGDAGPSSPGDAGCW